MRCSGIAAAAIVAASTSACDVVLVDPTEPAPEVELSVVSVGAQDVSYGDLSQALTAVRQVWFQFTHEGETRDTVVRAIREGGALQTRVALRPDEATGWLEVLAELRLVDGQPMFRGHGLVNARLPVPRAELVLVPIADAILGPAFLPFPALGVAQTPATTVTFTNGFPIEGAHIEWTSADPTIVEVVDGTLVSRSNGVVSVTASALDAERTYTVTVRQLPVVLTGLAPADTTVSVGASFQARAFGQDSNGVPLLPGAGVTWSASGVITVDPLGIVTAHAVGVGSLEITGASMLRTAQVTVAP